MKFYLGTHFPSWVWREHRVEVPLFVSIRRLRALKSWKPARVEWALDSGGFSELSQHGTWANVPPRQYVDEVRRARDEIGQLAWAAVQDWMCEPWIVEKTGLTVEEHQRRTIRSYLDLRARDFSIPWVPVVQGWTFDEYRRHLDMYDESGIDLCSFDTVGIGSVCRREGTLEAERIVRYIAAQGIALHGFGFKKSGLTKCHDVLASADSLAWSFGARRSRIRLPGCTHTTCTNCRRYAIQWRGELLQQVASAPPRQLQLALPA